MKEEDKYYIPENIPEFNLEYSFKDTVDEENKLIFTSAYTLLQTAKLLVEQSIMVKYLDQKDIESFGFKLTDPKAGLYESGNWDLLFTRNKLMINSPGKFGNFSGRIKNKRELEVLLKQIHYLK